MQAIAGLKRGFLDGVTLTDGLWKVAKRDDETVFIRRQSGGIHESLHALLLQVFKCQAQLAENAVQGSFLELSFATGDDGEPRTVEQSTVAPFSPAGHELNCNPFATTECLDLPDELNASHGKDHRTFLADCQ